LILVEDKMDTKKKVSRRDFLRMAGMTAGATVLGACAPQVVYQIVPQTQVVFQTQVVKETSLVQQTEVVEKVITPTAAVPETPLFYGAFATPIEEPWDGVIHQALKQSADGGKITYAYQDNIGYSGDMERVLGDIADTKKPAAIFGDAFGNEEAVRRVAVNYPNIAFVFGSGGGPADPNLSVFDNWIHEPAYLCGMLAGGLTKSNIIGVVGGYPVPEVNRLVNAFKTGAKEINANAKVKITFINSWFDLAAAKEAALALIGAGADVLFAERDGVIQAAADKNLFAFGNMSDQNSLAPNIVISGPVWNMAPTVDYVITQVESKTFTAQDLKDFSMVAKGGASLAPFHGLDAKIPPDLLKTVLDREAQIKSGLFRVDISEAAPTSD
jgi:basic membrane lipoprotein Med (substrate-binding protein (PBP1-ABC) superfamily)